MLQPTSRRCQLRRWGASIGLQLIAAGSSAAAPLERRQNDHQQQSSNQEDTPNNLGNSIAPQVWVPAVVVVLLLFGAFLFVWTRTSVVSRLRGAASRAVRSSTDGNTTREVTASQLAGGAAARAATTTTTRNNNNNVRPGRRTRRTPSQISTASLPVYMKEPGDHELVIFRGPEEMDASEAIAEAREAEDLDDEREESASLHVDERLPDQSQSAMSLGLGLGADADADGDASEPDTSTAELLPRGHQRSSDSHDSSDSRSILMRPVSGVPSDAPPEYDFESRSQSQMEEEERHSTSTAVIDPPGLTDSATAESAPPPSSSSPPPNPNPNQTAMAEGANRRSRFASRVSNLLHIRNGSSASNTDNAGQPEPANAATTESSPNMTVSVVSLNDPPPIPQSPILQHTRHRHSQSGGSSSTLNFALPFRTLSRQRSTNTLAHQRSSNTLNNGAAAASRSHVNLTSPSALSLSLAAGAISAPLSHTLVRTDIRYPAGGPTPDQIRLISSREGFGRFGMPYGEDAIAHAASSRQELTLDPPPEFESPATEEGMSAARRSGDGDGEGDDPDALPAGFVNESDDAALGGGSSPSRSQSSENAHPVETSRVLLPMFM